MTRHTKRALAALAFCVSFGLASTAWAVVLESIEFSSLPGDRTEIRMAFDGTPPEPRSFTTEAPARIILDLPATESALESKYHSLGIGNARNVTVMEAGERTRVVVALTNMVPHGAHVEGNDLVLMVGSGAGGVFSATPGRAGGRAAAGTTPTRVEDVDFRRGEAADGEIVLTLSDDRAPIDVSSEGGRVRVEIKNTALPSELQRRLDVRDFATPVNTVDLVTEGDDTVIYVDAAGEYDYLAYQADNVLVVNVKPALEAAERQRLEDVFTYQGEKLSLNFQDIEVRSVLQLIADFTDLNLVASDTVQGRITLRLKNVPWDQALALILKTKGLDQRQVGNVLLVAPADELAAREKLELENNKQIAELAPLRTEFIQVRYAKASELFALLEQREGPGILSDRGSVVVDERTNSIILTETADKLEQFRRILEQLDIPVRQVLIEARIVTATTNVAQELGIRWGGGKIKARNPATVRVGGSLETLGELQDIVVGGTGFGEISSPDDLVVDLGVSGGGASSFAVGLTGNDYIIDVELSALASEGKAEVVARPKVITADKQEAKILSGTQIPFQEASSSGATSTSFKDAVLSLNVTPQITPDDRIILDLTVNQDSVGKVFNGVPSINTNQVQTQVLVNDGETVVLGGIFQTQTSEAETKTPFLGDLPFVGRLFKRTTSSEDKTELLIFVTPRLIKDALVVR